MMIDPHKIDFVIYHANCSDGFSAAWAAHKLLGNKATYYAAHHGVDPPDVAGKNVAILDFSYSNATTKKMIADAASLIILDHHKSAYIELHDIDNLYYSTNHSGAILSWKFFHPEEEPPKFLRYVEDRDLWKWQLPYSKEFSAAFDMVQFDDFENYDLFQDDSVVDDAIQRGKYILAYSHTVIKKMTDRAAKRKLHGKQVLVANSSHWMSEIGAKLSTECDFACIWYYDHNRRVTCVSLRSFHENIDVSEIAKEFGGGGHKKAAGFSLPTNVHIENIFDKEE